jgi:class 3 adenylate cyclase
LEGRLEDTNSELSDDGVQQMLQLAERLREENGGTLDDSAILAVAEATGAPVEYVRLAVKIRTDSDRRRLPLDRIRETFLTMEPDVRRYVTSGVIGTFVALLSAAELATRGAAYDPSAIFGILKIVAVTLGLYNICVSRDSRTAAISGAILGSLAFTSYAIFAFVMRVPSVDPSLIIPATLGGAVGGLALFRLIDRYRGRLGLQDPVRERQDLLRQLVDLQEKLRSGEQSMTFLSVDIVGSTRMKEIADPLSIEFTFNEYHKFVEMVVRRYGGRVHSTAGDGMTCAFEHPQQGFAAAKNLQTGILELNTYRNKIGMPIALRCGVHCGTVMTPTAGDVKSVNFAHVIDIAAHLQKVCPEGGVVVSESAAAHLPGGLTAVGNERVEAQNVRGLVWIPRQSLAMGVGPHPAEPPAEPRPSQPSFDA